MAPKPPPPQAPPVVVSPQPANAAKRPMQAADSASSASRTDPGKALEFLRSPGNRDERRALAKALGLPNRDEVRALAKAWGVPQKADGKNRSVPDMRRDLQEKIATALAEPESSDLLQQRRHLLPLRGPACTRFRGYALQGSNASVIVFRMIKFKHW